MKERVVIENPLPNIVTIRSHGSNQDIVYSVDAEVDQQLSDISVAFIDGLSSYDNYIHQLQFLRSDWISSAWISVDRAWNYGTRKPKPKKPKPKPTKPSYGPLFEGVE